MRLRVVPAGMSVLAMIMGWVVVRGMERAGVGGVSLCFVPDVCQVGGKQWVTVVNGMGG